MLLIVVFLEDFRTVLKKLQKSVLIGSILRMYVREKQADLKNVGRRGSANLHHFYVA